MTNGVAAHRVRVAAWAVLLTICASFTAWHITFAGMAAFDDEGYMMWTVKNFLDGHALYDQVATVYGPFYYLYEWCALSIARAPAAADSLRLVSDFFWVAAALMAFLLAYRATKSLILATAVHLLAFRAMVAIGEAPVHPQEACIFLLLALGCAFFVGGRRVRMMMLGALAGAIAASKVNLGVFVLVALTVGIAFAQRPGWRRRVACVVVSLAALPLPVVLIWDRRTSTWAVLYAVLVILSVGAVLIIVSRIPWKSSLGPRDAVLAAASFAITTGAICCFPLAQGSTVYGLFEWLIIIPEKEYGVSWALPANIHPIAIAWACLGLCTAWYAGTRRLEDGWAAMLKVAFGAGTLFLCATDRYGGFLNYATPFLWLVATRPLAPNSPTRHNHQDPLSFLALLGVFQSLYGYPVAGAQIALVSVPMIVIAGICAWDGFKWLEHRAAAMTRPEITSGLVPAARTAVIVLLAGVNLAYAWSAQGTYRERAPLNLPGSRQVHVEPTLAVTLQTLVAHINASCGTLVTEPGLFSFHLWTGKPSPRGIDHQVWMALVNDQKQADIVREVAGDPRACVVYQQEVVDLWTRGSNVADKPMVAFIRNNFHTVYESNGYRLLMRK
uniref:Glycosyltransferase RgtA/B/C/D-like domain-containing protein n=1 Tax=Solibacter usitatus (strain Ellin6076) TaxID=234267 RepID=Q01WP8_SOLUE